MIFYVPSALKASFIPYERPSDVSISFWDSMTPYLLPENSPEKAALDRIFTKRRVLSSVKSMEKSGFLILTDPDRPVVVAIHQKLNRYIIKAYLDTYNNDEGEAFKRRAVGALLIQNRINAHHFEHLMTVPKKWIYALPIHPDPKPGNTRKNFIILCERMSILKWEKNKSAYKKKMTEEHLKALYLILTENMLIDSIYIDNIPFCKDGRIAFVDTEHFQRTDVFLNLEHLTHNFSPSLQQYWQKLIVNGPN